jgi:hypothetical protein
MPQFIKRDTRGRIIGAWSAAQFSYQEPLAEDDPGLTRYLLRSTLSRKLAMLNLSTDDMAALSTQVGMFVDRDEHGRVCGTYEAPQREHQERLPLHSPDLQDYLAAAPEGVK